MEAENDESQSTSLYALPLSKNITKEHLQEIFGNFGTVTNLEITDISTNPQEPMIFAKVSFDDEAILAKAERHLNNAVVDGQILQVSRRSPKTSDFPIRAADARLNR